MDTVVLAVMAGVALVGAPLLVTMIRLVGVLERQAAATTAALATAQLPVTVIVRSPGWVEQHAAGSHQDGERGRGSSGQVHA